MEVQDKLDLKKDLKRLGLEVSVRDLNVIVVHFDKAAKKIHRKYYMRKIGMRSIYSIIFILMGVVALLNSYWIFMTLNLVIAVYNTIHLISNYVFYKNNFSDNPIKPKPRVEQT